MVESLQGEDVPIGKREEEGEAAVGSSDTRLSSIAEQSLRHFEETVTVARLELGEPRRSAINSFAVLNSLTNEQAVRSFEQLTQSQINELRQLCNEPAIARIVAEDESGATKVYFISRATPHRSPSDGSAAVSYRAPVGRLASLPVGAELELSLTNGLRTLTVVERALLGASLIRLGTMRNESIVVVTPYSESVYVMDEVGIHRLLQISIPVLEFRHVVGWRTGTDLSLIQIVINNRDIEHVVDPIFFNSLF